MVPEFRRRPRSGGVPFSLGAPVPVRVRVLVAAAATASLVAACGSGETAGSGAPASSATSSPATTPSASPSGNGVAALSAEEILGRSKAALAAAEYVRITGSADDAGSRITVDMRYGPERAVGTFIVDGLRLDLSRVGNAVYLKAGRDFWTEYADARVAKLIGGKSVRATLDDERFVDLSGLTDLKASAYDFLDLGGPLTRGAARTEAGRPVIEVIDSSDDGGTLYVATDGEPYPLSVRSASDKVTFTDYGKEVTVSAPAAAQVLDADTLPAA
jgi:hypothetical protein